jgi:uncharacterized protein YejL (UPF0352 family)
MITRPRGLYEVLITEAIEAQLRDLGSEWHAVTSAVRSAEAPDRLALHLGRIVKRVLTGVDDAQRVAVGVALARALIQEIDAAVTGSPMRVVFRCKVDAPTRRVPRVGGHVSSRVAKKWAVGWVSGTNFATGL